MQQNNTHTQQQQQQQQQQTNQGCFHGESAIGSQHYPSV